MPSFAAAEGDDQALELARGAKQGAQVGQGCPAGVELAGEALHVWHTCND